MDIKGHTLMVTGSVRRVGRGIAEALAEAGASVVVVSRNHSDAEQAAKELEEQFHARAIGLPCDIGRLDEKGAQHLFERANAHLGPVHGLVNSASGFPESSLADITLEKLRETAQLTAFGPVLLTRALAEQLPEGERGVVINVNDWVALERGYPDHLAYVMAKHALHGLTITSARDLAPRIRVNEVALGAILPPPGEGQDYIDKLAKGIPLKRAGGVEVVGQAVRALVENDFVTGETLRLSGGAHLV